ncbi:MAG: Xaa-Pro peptidase family protein, partial [Chloroflexota bacterium]
LIQAEGINGVAIVPGPNMLHLTGLHFHLGDRPTVLFILLDKPPVMVIPSIEILKVIQWKDLVTFPWNDEHGFHSAFLSAVRRLELGGRRIGIESYLMRHIEINSIQQSAPDCELVGADDLISKSRLSKDESEVARIQTAVIAAEKAMERALAKFKPGMTEKTFKSVLQYALLQEGAEGLSFDPIVASGPNAANPHATPSDRPITENEFFLCDWGATIDGYSSDITRTFAVGKVGAKMEEAYQTVLEANRAAREIAGPGVTCREVDEAARRVIESASYGDYFTHRTGHGLGLQVHEDPYISASNDQVLKPGMVFTIEPGIYLPDKFGVRIEDDVVVTEDGCRSLTTMSRELRRLF